MLSNQIKTACEMGIIFNLYELLGQVKMAYHLKAINKNEFEQLYLTCLKGLVCFT